jgi:RHS repeat-associated protein
MKRHARPLFVFAVAAALPPLWSSPLLADVGRTEGTVDVSRVGELTYRIPLALPAGVNGLTPQLALTYEHRRAAFSAGVGWTIEGLPRITRCAKTVAQDGVADNIQVTTADKFCLDGNRLRLVGTGPYGGANTEYRLQLDTVARLTIPTVAGGGDPQSFKMEEKSGLTYEFGATPSSRIETLIPGKTNIAYIWAINKITDRAGNAISFTYQEDSAPNGAYRISQIQYTSGPSYSPLYTIDFVYEAKPTGDVSAGNQYVAGGNFRETKRLDRIDITHNSSSTLVRRYELAYEGALSNTGLSRLQSITECAGSPLACLTPTTFGYSNGTSGLGSEVSAGSSPVSPMSLDINGDGIGDIAYSSSTTSGGGTWRYQLGLATGGFGAAVNTGLANTNYANAIVLNYDGDNKDDILVQYSGTTWWVLRGTSSGLASPINTSLTTSGMGGTVSIDWNGDGLDDLVSIQTGGAWVNYRNGAGAGFAAKVAIGTATGLGTGHSSKTRHRVLDVNGDGIQDVLFSNAMLLSAPPPLYAYSNGAFLGGGKGTWLIDSYSSSAVPTLINTVGDFNGDGYTDLIFRTQAGNLAYRTSTGTSFASSISLGAVALGDATRSVAIDWNGDGFDDLAMPNTASGTWHVYPSDGTGLTAGVNTGVPTNSPTMVQTIDVNGDGLDDLGYIKSTGQYAVLPRAGALPDYLTSITDGYGNVTNVSYLALSQGAYTPNGSPATFPNRELIGSLAVVRQVASSNGIGGMRTQTYDYFDSQLNVAAPAQVGATGASKTFLPNPAPARGYKSSMRDAGNSNQTQFKGFGTIRVLDSVTALYNYRDYSQADPPLLGMRTANRLYQSDGTTPIVNETTIWTPKVVATGFDGYAFPYPSTRTQQVYEFAGPYNGALKRTVVEQINVIDTYATVLDSTTSATEAATGNGAQGNTTYTTNTVASLVQNATANWCPGKPQQVQVTGSHTKVGGYGTAITRTRTMTWDTTSPCRLTTEVIEPSSTSGLTLTRTLGYDAYGNVSNISLSGLKNSTVAETRTTEIDYTYLAAEPGRFPTRITNAEGEGTYQDWYYETGLQKSTKDPNNQLVEWQYDKFGRALSEVRREDGTNKTSTTWSYAACTPNCINSNHVLSVTQIEKNNSDTEFTRSLFSLDRFERLLRSQTKNVQGNLSQIDREYNAQGELHRESTPCIGCATPTWISHAYDALGRLTQVSRATSDAVPATVTQQYAYEGMTTRITDWGLKQAWRVQDAVGRLARSTDTMSYSQDFDYDGFGALRKVSDSQGNALFTATYAYGAGAYRTTSKPIDAERDWTWTPNTFGDTYAWQNAKNQNFSATFDKLSRMRTRTDVEGTSTFVYGTSAALHNVGQLTAMYSTMNGYREDYLYDQGARLSQNKIIYGGTTNYYDLMYSAALGALESITYPTTTGTCRLKVAYAYDYGQLKSVTDASDAVACGSTGTVYWQANEANARGQVTKATLGNGLINNRLFDSITGQLRSVMTGTTGSPGSVQSLGYLYDAVGSLIQRQDNRQSLTEDFYTDSLHRLDYSVLGGTQNLDMDYDLLGRVTKKSDLGAGAWTYDSVKVHRLLNAANGAVTYTYDDNGNVVARNGTALTWASFDYPTLINTGNESDEFTYGPARQRWRHVYTSATQSETTTNIGNLLEKVFRSGTVNGTDWRHWIIAGDEAVALVTRKGGGTVTTRYPLYDHLGSHSGFAKSNGTIDIDESYAAFGQRRNGNTWQLPLPSTQDTAIANISRHGFTGHSHLIGSSLIHMNGRVQDPTTGHFLSIDPIAADPEMSQAWNAYSYVYNSPLDFVDPTGLYRQCVAIPVFQWSYTPDGQIQVGGGFVPVCVDIPDEALIPRTSAGNQTFDVSIPSVDDVGSWIDEALRPDTAICIFDGGCSAKQWGDALFKTSMNFVGLKGGGSLLGRSAAARAVPRLPGPRFHDLAGHAAKHSTVHPNAYYNAAVRHLESGSRFTFRHDGQFKNAFITRTGADSFSFTSASRSGDAIFTHIEGVSTQYLRNIGITLPRGF